MSEPIKPMSFVANSTHSDGTRSDFMLYLTRDHHEEYGGPYLVTMGAGAYVADPETGTCRGVEGTEGCTVHLYPGGLKRLRKHLGLVRERMEKLLEYKTTSDMVMWNDKATEVIDAPNPISPDGSGWKLVGSALGTLHFSKQLVLWFWEREMPKKGSK